MKEELQKIEEFIETNNSIFTSMKNVFDINFSDIIKIDNELGDELLDNPEETIEFFKHFISTKIDKKPENFHIKFFNLPETNNLKISSIRKENIDKLYCFEGIVSRITDVIANTTYIKFECPSCGKEMNIPQFNDVKNIPTHCVCKRRGKMRQISETLENIQKIMLEDFIIEREGTYKPVMKLVILRGLLTDPLLSKRIQPSASVKIIGVLKTRPINKDGLEKEFYIEANNIEIKDKSLLSIKFEKDEIEQLKELSKDEKLLDKLAQSISPGTEGMDMEKKALVIQHFRADNIYDENNKLDDRGTINIAIIGPPGSSKTYLAKKSINLNPISIFTSGKGLSGVGLIAAVTFDRVLNCWTLDPGAVPICNKGIILIDECDKIDTENISYLNNAMNDLEVPINKANVRAILETDTCFLCCANPRYRLFDNSIEKFRQLGLPPDFLDRFDLIFAVESSGEQDQRRKIIRKIIKRYKREVKAVIDYKTFTKYIAYAWQHIHPEIDDSLVDYLENKIDEVIDPKTKKKTEVSVRIVGTVLRLSKAIARMYYSNKVRHKDVDLALELLMHSFRSMEMIDESSKISIEDFQAKSPQKKIQAHKLILELLEKNDTLSYEQIEEVMKVEIPGTTTYEIDEVIEKLRRSGDIYEQKRGFFKKL